MTTVFKIRHKVTGLYSTGGIYPKWVGLEKSKSWNKRNHASCPPSQFKERNGLPFSTTTKQDLENWEIVPFIVKLIEVK